MTTRLEAYRAYVELCRVAAADTQTYTPGDTIVWLTYFPPLPGSVITVTRTRVVIRVQLSDGQLVERAVRSNRLAPRPEAR